MNKEYHPSVSIDFVLEQLKKSPKIIEGSFGKIGNTTHYFVVNGRKPISKRLHVINVDENNEINFIQATGLAINFSFITALMNWYEKEKGWKEGDYFEQ
ncbi:hypothetical protein PFY12_00135 [Chryseobacterium camelliae]|uniref:Uncharacterized protein n=1 Tax=Chryseobacterium camelliae TaxID=1265445 RepID=A0ABY7QLI2_9FLAO|nr:hypothetical protein [Chryseobacterium camelliae]WBV60542.1 hypothetical protein PFY12_00135 [Chryseobacterium camelliae]